MSKTRLITICDKCGKEDSRELGLQRDSVSCYWRPPHWQMHNTEDGDGPEPHKVFMLCDTCEAEFQLTVRAFKPSGNRSK